MDESAARARARRIVSQRLESLVRAGVMHLPKSSEGSLASLTTAVSTGPVPESSGEARAGAAAAACEDRGPKVDKVAALRIIQEEVARCTRCAELARTRTQTVFGVGNPNARLCFFGEAPGADEDRLGEPFVGRAGKLLTDIIEKGMGFKRSDVYIMNVLKCRPPDNRTPNAEECANCREFFERQFETLDPPFICCLGTVAAQNLLQTTVPVGRLRGKIHRYRNARVIVTYHPSYLLRNPPAKKDTWEDIQMLLREMGVPIPGK